MPYSGLSGQEGHLTSTKHFHRNLMLEFLKEKTLFLLQIGNKTCRLIQKKKICIVMCVDKQLITLIRI